jgi:hypothetical protein
MKKFIILSFRLTALACLLLWCNCAIAAIFTDNFDDNWVDSTMWEVSTRGIGPQVNEINGRLEVTLPSYTTSVDNLFYAGYLSRQYLRGDFDMQVDFQLLDWPTSPRYNGIRVGLCLDWVQISHGGSAVRASEPGVERYTTTAVDAEGTPSISWIVKNDAIGSLRLTRSDSMISGYLKDGENWSLIGSGMGDTEDGRIVLFGWGHDDFVGQNVGFAFDNFILTEGQLVPEPATLLLLGLGGLLLRRKHSKA